MPLQIADPRAAGKGSYGVNLVRTMIFGAAPLFTRNIPQLMPVLLRPDVGLLDFDAPRDQLDCDAAEAEAVTAAVLARSFATRAGFETLGGAAMDLFGDLMSAARGTPYDGRLRAAFAEPFGTPPVGVRLCHTVGYAESASDRLVLPIAGSIVGEAARRALEGIDQPLVFEPLTDIPDSVSLKDPSVRIARNRAATRRLAFLAAMPIDVAALGALPNAPYGLAVDGTTPTGLALAHLEEIAGSVQDALPNSLKGRFPAGTPHRADKDRRRGRTRQANDRPNSG